MGRLKQTALQEQSGLTSPAPTPTKTSTPKKKSKAKKTEMTTINIKIPKSSKQWLTERSQQVRDNNSEPVPPRERVYPQHLINMAIELLQNSDLDWSQIKNIEDLQQQLNP